MKIALFTNQFPGKVNSFFSRDVRGLINNGCEVDIFPIHPLDKSYWEYVPAFLDESILSRNRIHHLKLMDFVSFRLFFDFLLNISFILPIIMSSMRYGVSAIVKTIYSVLSGLVLSRIEEKEYDHIFSYWGNYAGTYALVYRNTSKNIHTPFSILFHAGTDLYRDQVYLKEKLLAAYKVFVVCEFNIDFIRNLFPESFKSIEKKIFVHHLGIDLDDYRYTNKKRKGRVLAVGRIERRKGFDLLLDAFYDISKTDKDLVLEFVGDGPQYKELKDRAINLGIEDQVFFHGWVKYNKVKKIIEEATMLVHPSPEIGDAVPTVIKEAMALGTPVIGTKIAGIPELLDNGRCGILIEPKNISAIHKSIKKLLYDSSLQMSLSDLGREYMEKKFNIDSNVRLLLERIKN